MNAGLRKFALFGIVVIIGMGIALWQILPSTTNQGYIPEQPVPFSHKVHAGQYKIECRYCHTGAFKANHAGIPPLATCMNCHSVVQAIQRKEDGSELKDWSEYIRKHYDDGKPIEWLRVHELPDHVHFNHTRHIAKGVQCETCHGNVKEMERVYQEKPLNMGWCLDCHRGFETPKYIRRNIFPEHPDGTDPVAPFNCNTCHY